MARRGGGCRDAIFLAVGTGIGAGILADGRVLRGEGGIAGAIGWLALDRPFLPEYKDCGCFESHASGEGLGSRRPRSPRAAKGLPGPSAKETFDHGPGRVPSLRARRRGRQEGSGAGNCFLGHGLRNLISLFNPETIIFGGGVRPGDTVSR